MFDTMTICGLDGTITHDETIDGVRWVLTDNFGGQSAILLYDQDAGETVSTIWGKTAILAPKFHRDLELARKFA